MIELFFTEPVVVCKPFGDVQLAPEVRQFALKTFRACDAGYCADMFALQPFERQLLVRIQIL